MQSRRVRGLSLVMMFTGSIVLPSFAERTDLQRAPNPLIAGSDSALFFSSATDFPDGTLVKVNGEPLATTNLDGSVLVVDLPAGAVVGGDNTFEIVEPGGGTDTGDIPGGIIVTPGDSLAALQLQAAELADFVPSALATRRANDLDAIVSLLGRTDFDAAVRTRLHDSAHFARELRRLTDRSLMDLQLDFERFLTDFFRTHRSELSPPEFQRLRLDAHLAVRTARLQVNALVREFLRILPDWRTAVLNGKVTPCGVTINIAGWGINGSSAEFPSASIGVEGNPAEDVLTVEFTVNGTIDDECRSGLVTVRVSITGEFLDLGNQQKTRRELARGVNSRNHGVFRVWTEPGTAAYSGPNIQVDPDSGTSTIRRADVNREIERMAEDFRFNGNDTLRIEIYATIVSDCGCVADDQFRCEFPEVLSVPSGGTGDYPNLGEESRQDGIEPCVLDIQSIERGAILAQEPQRDPQGELQGDDVTGFLGLAIISDGDCAPTTVWVDTTGSDSSSLTYEFFDTVQHERDVVNAEPHEHEVEGEHNIVSFSFRVPLEKAIDAVDDNAVDPKHVSHAWETMGLRIVVRATDECGCQVTRTLDITRER